MNLKLSKTAVRELTRLYRGVLVAAIIATAVTATSAKAALNVVTAFDAGTSDASATTTDIESTVQGLADGQIAASVADTTTDGALGKLLGEKADAATAANTSLGNLTTAGENIVKGLADGQIAASVADTTTDGALGKLLGEKADAATVTALSSTVSEALTNISVSVTDGVATIHDDAAGTANVYTTAKAAELFQDETEVKTLISAAAGNGLTSPSTGTLAVQVQNNKGLEATSSGVGIVTSASGGLLTDANGLSIKLNNTASDKYESGLVTTSDGLALQLNNSASDKYESGLKTTSTGLEVALKANAGLQSSTEGLSVLADNSTLEVSSGGIRIKQGGVGSYEIAANAVTSEKIAAGAVGTNQIAASAVTKDQILAGTITYDRLNAGAIANSVANEANKLITAQAVYNETRVAGSTYNVISSSNTAAQNIVALDGAIGDMSDFATDNNYAKNTDSVAANLTSLDGALKSTNDILGAKETGEISSTSLVTGKIGNEITVVAALRQVADNAAGLDADNNFTGSNTFKENTTFEKGITLGASSALAEATGIAYTGLGSSTPETDQTILKVSGVDALVAENAVASTQGFSVVQKSSGTSYKELVSLDSSGLKISDGTNVNFSVANDGTVVTKGTVDINGALLTGADDSLTSTQKVISANGFEVTGTTSLADNLLTVGASTLSNTALEIGAANAITGATASLDMGANAVSNVKGLTLTDGAATDPKTVALTVVNDELSVNKIVDATQGLKFSSDATAMTSVGRDEIIAKVDDDNNKSIVASAQAVQATRAAINAENAAVFGGLYEIDADEATLAYNGDALAADGFVAGQTDLTASLTNYAANVKAATGGTFAANGAWAGTVDNTTSNGYDYSDGATSLVAAISQVAGNVGTADDLTTAGTNGVAADQTVNANIDAINGTIGNIRTLSAGTGSTGNAITNGTGTAATTVVEALNNIDATLGKIHGLKATSDLGDKSNLAEGTTVEQHLVSLDNAIGDLTQLVDSRYASDTVTVADSMMALDNNLGRVENKVDALDKRVNKMHHEMKSGFASLAAMSALVPNARVAGDTQIAVGTGYYRGTTGFAVGAFHHLNDSVLLNAGASYAGNGAAVFKGGVTFGF